MGAMDKFLNFMKIGQDDDLDDGYYDDDDDYVDEPVVETKQPIQAEERFTKQTSEKKPVVTSQQAPVARKKVVMSDNSVIVFKPKAFDEAREIADTLLQDKTVVMNFEGVEIAVSQRVLDIVTGACIAIGGNLQKISNYIFIATPASVDVSGDFQDNLTGVFNSI